MAERLTKVEQRWQYLADRIWYGTFTGWTGLSDRVTKADRAIVARKVKAGHVEVSEWGQYRLTEAGRQALRTSDGGKDA
ncbi:hypothetical protein [Bosea sp. FBZP-16]|uniref:hypothetical protein n=1 Tax=Bosea sp. FBZP-16 TaxID=2065382 RepID=UPI000C303B51|nr:hypothetical protein [Bosea sp. FBZP-16]